MMFRSAQLPGKCPFPTGKDTVFCSSVHQNIITCITLVILGLWERLVAFVMDEFM